MKTQNIPAQLKSTSGVSLKEPKSPISASGQEQFLFTEGCTPKNNPTKTEYSRYAFSDNVSGMTQLHNDSDMNHQYYIFSSKLVKFRDTKLRAIKFT